MTLRLPVSLAILSTCSFASSSPWNQFRGPNGSGVAPTDAKPPLEIGADSIAWQTPVPPGKSSPVVSDGRVFLTALEDGRKLVTLAFDRKTGKPLWRAVAPEVALEKVHEASSPAMSTP